MKKWLWILSGIFLISGFSLGILIRPLLFEGEQFIPELKVTGDVGSVLSIRDLEIFGDPTSLEYKEQRFDAVPLKRLIDESKPQGEDHHILIVGSDGRTAKLDYDDLGQCYISFSNGNGWQSLNLNHPVSTNIKNIKDIVVVSGTESPGFGLTFITPHENILNITPGQAYLQSAYLFNEEGQVSMDKEDREYSSSIYTEKKVLEVGKILEDIDPGRALLMERQGRVLYIDNEHFLDDGLLEIDENHLNYASSGKSGTEAGDVVGIMIKSPAASVTDVYHDSVYFLEQGERVMVIILDGFGYHQYDYALEHGHIPFLEEAGDSKIASAVFKPVTNTGLAAMFTGKTPDENGVHDRKNREMAVPSIFNYVLQNDKKTIYIEGDIQILKTEIDPMLNIDEDADGSKDDDIFECAMAEIEKDFDYFVVHFHTIDEMGHDYGDLAEVTMQTVELLDFYVRELVSKWKGQVIVTSDHGMHPTPEGGSHGEFRYEDMLVPYIYIEKDI